MGSIRLPPDASVKMRTDSHSRSESISFVGVSINRRSLAGPVEITPSCDSIPELISQSRVYSGYPAPATVTISIRTEEGQR